MFEKVNPSHPDKVADRIAGAIVDLAYSRQNNPTCAVEVLIGHGICNVTIESTVMFNEADIKPIVDRITTVPDYKINLVSVAQDVHLNDNQKGEVRCGDNGIFKGVPVTDEEKHLAAFNKAIYEKFSTDGKFILADDTLTVCQSHASNEELLAFVEDFYNNSEYHRPSKIIINPIGYWTGSPSVDSGATNRKLGSDMSQSVTGGGLCGKDISKADVSTNIYAFLKAQETGVAQEFHCSIGDTIVNGVPYAEMVKVAKDYIDSLGGFEKFSEYGLVR